MQNRLRSGEILSEKFVVIVVFLLAWACCCFCWTPGKVCTGTSFGLRRTGYAGNWSLQRYIRLYENCVYVDGNLEITYLENGLYDLSFLSTIQEVSGYVIIAFVSVTDVIPLHNLRVIRGRSLFHDPDNPNSRGYSLYVANNYVRSSPGIRLKELQLTALREIMDGSVMFSNNLCYVNTIAWSDILTGRDATITYTPSDPSQPTPQCDECDASCVTDGEQHCWGAGPDMCQTLVRRCNARCGDSCYGPGETECCSRQCVGGCSGPERTQCYACARFIDDGECVSFCSPPFIYDPQTHSLVPNPDVKYEHSIMCVANCPEYMLIDGTTCVSDCHPNSLPVDGTCQPCDGQCTKVCDAAEYVNADNIASLTGCTEIRGILRILNSGVIGETRPVERHQLEVLASVETITGALVVKTNDTNIADLSFLRNLHTIHGRQLEHGSTALVIVRSSLQSLGLRSLRSIPRGRIFMGFNSRLCYADTVNWEMITGRANVARLKENGQECGSCSRFCDPNGCWGPGDDQCIQCDGYRLQGRCVDFCDLANGYFVNLTTRECWPCHSECRNTCTGPGSDECDACRHVQDGPDCEAECPSSTYTDSAQICRPCHPNCLGNCTGPTNRLGQDGCNSCEVVVLESDTSYCLSPWSDCPHNFFPLYRRDNWIGRRYVECWQCHDVCDGCYGPSRASCITCRYLKLYDDIEGHTTDTPFSCVEQCPEWAPAELLEVTGDDTTAICVTWDMYNAQQGGLR